MNIKLNPEQIEAAAKTIAQCMDYPWEHMPEQGRATMRKHAQAVLFAGLTSPALPIDFKQATDQGGWQPIATAPKDGTPIIIADIGDGQVYDVVHGWFEVLSEDEEDGPWSLDGGEPHCSYVGRAEGTYFCSWLPGKELERGWRVTESFGYTHWQLCSAAPTLQGVADGDAA